MVTSGSVSAGAWGIQKFIGAALVLGGLGCSYLHYEIIFSVFAKKLAESEFT
jgi:hypothetical protein